MKKVYAVLLGLATFGQAYAKPVDINAAKTIGLAFLNKNASVALPNGVKDMQTVYTATTNINGASTACYYVFNAANGFVIVSADDNVKPVLAFSENSVFGTTNIPTHVQWWMDNYTNQISYVIKNSIPATEEIAGQWTELAAPATTAHNLAKTTDVLPLLHFSWDQYPYYNELCPGTGNNQAVTGCVATAMAQVIKFWSWPAVGVGSHTYTDNNYGIQTVNFASHAYNYTAMPASISSFSTAAAKTAIATLMYDCGVSVNMGYNIAANGGSGALVELPQSYGTSVCAESALKTYFKYKTSLHGDLRATYNTTADWENALKTDIDAGRPVIYTGFGQSDGHCWLAEGYKTTTTGTLFYFNWGWSGTSNAYFTVDNLAPSVLGTGGGNGNFNNNQAAIFGIEPDKSMVTDSTNSMKLYAPINMAYSPQTYQQPLSFTASLYNITGAAFTGDVTAEVFDRNNKLVTTLPSVSVSNLGNDSVSATLNFTASVQNLFTMTPDIYGIRIYYRPTGGTWTAVGDNGKYINYTRMEIVDDGGTQLMDSLQGTQAGRILPNGVPVSISTMLGSGATYGSYYTGTIDAALYDPATQAVVFDIQQIPNASVPGDGTAYPFTFTSTASLNVAPGTYVLMVGDMNGSQVTPFGSTFYQNPMLVTVPFPTGVNTVIAQSDVKVYPNPATDVVYVDLRGVNATQINVLDMAGRTIETVQPAKGAVATIPVENLAAGMYLVQIHTDSKVITKKISVTK